MGRLMQIWRSWSARRRAVAGSLAALAVAALVVGGYLVLKRPPDVTNTSVAFDAKEEQPRLKKPKDKTVNWPTYGYTNDRTRYFPSTVVRPPYAPSDWSFPSGKLLEFSPIVVDDVVYFMDIDARFYARDAKTGKGIWRQRIGKLNASAPAYDHGRLFAVSLAPGQAVALRARDGKVLWRTPLPGRSESSPLVYKGNLVIFGCECGTIFALDTDNGKIKWRVQTAGPVKGALALGQGTVYGGNYAGEFFAIDASSGRQEWRINTIGGSFGRGGGVYSTPAVAFGRVYFGSIDSRVYSLDRKTGEIAWSKSTGAEVYSGPAVADTPGSGPTVYIGSADDNFYALDARSGATRWQKNAGGDITGAPSVIGNVVYVSVIGKVGTIGYKVKNGKEVFRHELGEYNPAITDGQRLFLTGYNTLRAFRSVKLKRAEKRQERRRKRLRRELRGERPDAEGAEQQETQRKPPQRKRGGKGKRR